MQLAGPCCEHTVAGGLVAAPGLSYVSFTCLQAWQISPDIQPCQQQQLPLHPSPVLSLFRACRTLHLSCTARLLYASTHHPTAAGVLTEPCQPVLAAAVLCQVALLTLSRWEVTLLMPVPPSTWGCATHQAPAAIHWHKCCSCWARKWSANDTARYPTTWHLALGLGNCVLSVARQQICKQHA